MTRTTEYRYTVDSLLAELVCRNGEDEQVTRWEYGVGLYTEESVTRGVARNDLVRAKIYPDGGDDRVEYAYDRLGEVVKFADQNGNVHEYSYDTIGRMTEDYAAEVPYFDVGQVRHIGVEYAPRGEVIHVYSKDAGQEHILSEVEYTYNGFGQVLNETVSTRYTSGQTVSYAYDSPTGVPNTVRRTGMTYPSGRALSFAYSGNVIDERMDRLSTIVGDPGGTPFDIAKYSWLGAGTSVKTEFTQPQVEMTTVDNDADGDAGDKYVGLDRFGRLEDARWKKSGDDIERVEYGFDRVGNRTWRRNRVAPEARPFDEKYAYDGLYQVTGLQRGKMNQNTTAIGGVPTWAEGWRYDEMGNWLGYGTAVNGDAELDQRRTYNKANELLMISEDGGALSNATLAHDPAGNMTRMPKVDDWDESRVLKWDAWNRLIAIYEADGTTLVAKYQYDALNRRILKTTGEVVRRFAYSDQWQVLEELTGEDGAGMITLTREREFVWGVKTLDDLILRDVFDGGDLDSRNYALNDGKNVTAIVNTSGVVQERYAYRGFGYTEVLDSDFEPREDNESDFTWETRFCGYRWDWESELYQVRYRYYHPQLGRWLSRDPIGEEGGLNTFSYVFNTPNGWKDSFGLAVDNDLAQAIHDGGVKDAQASEAFKKRRRYHIEYCGLVCGQKDCSGKWAYQITGPIPGGPGWCKPWDAPCPEGWAQKGVHHSHPAGSPNPSTPGTAIGGGKGDTGLADSGHWPKDPKDPKKLEAQLPFGATSPEGEHYSTRIYDPLSKKVFQGPKTPIAK